MQGKSQIDRGKAGLGQSHSPCCCCWLFRLLSMCMAAWAARPSPARPEAPTAEGAPMPIMPVPSPYPCRAEAPMLAG